MEPDKKPDKVVTVYGASWCVNCKQLTRQLDLAKVKYTYVEIDEDSKPVYKYGIRSLPTTIISEGREDYTVDASFAMLVGSDHKQIIEELGLNND